MMKLYAQFWVANLGGSSVVPVTPEMAIGLSLRHLAETLDRKLTTAAIESYLAGLSGYKPAEIVLAFSRATEECRFFPPPSILREFSGRVVEGDPIAREAKDELLALLQAMRGPHGPMLKPIPGKVLYGTEAEPRDEQGRCAAAPIRAESTPFPMRRRTQAALVRLGWGDGARGIAVVADHPGLRREVFTSDNSDPQFRQNQLRASDEILKRWTDAYREVL